VLHLVCRHGLLDIDSYPGFARVGNMTATTHVYAVADTADFTRTDPPSPDNSAALHADEEILSAFPPQEPARPRSAAKRWLWLVVPVLIVVVSAAVAGAVVRNRRHAQSAKDGTPSVSSPTAPAQPASSGTSVPAVLPSVPDGPPRTYNFSIVEALPHDPEAFVEGFVYNAPRSVFFESTGLTEGKSSLRRVDVKSGKVLKLVKLPSPELFGEGIALYRSTHIYMLTWKAQRGFIFDQETLELQREWNYTGEGWGLTTDPRTDLVYMSDGTNEIRVLEPETLAEKRRIAVTDNGQPLRQLNELEWVCGELWANVWLTSNIVRIDPSTGRVRSVIKVDNLPRREDITGAAIDVLNGIAFDEASSRIWVTGKQWPKVYQVAINDPTFGSQCGH
jgi:glutaminyl-peptide cyclotransferase